MPPKLREQTAEEDILWHLLGHERYEGATLSSSPERSVSRGLMGSPEQYTSEKVDDVADEPYGHDVLASPRRQTRFAEHTTPIPPSPSIMPPSPDISAYMYAAPQMPPMMPPMMPPPPAAPPPPPEPTARERAQAALRQRFDTQLSDLERDLCRHGARRSAGSRQQPLPPPPAPSGSGEWIYGWQPPASSYEWRRQLHHQQHEQQQQQQQQHPHPHPRSSHSLYEGDGAATAAADAINAAADEVDKLDLLSSGAALPRWQPMPSRVAVEETMDSLYAAEAHLLFRRTSMTRALRVWALSEDTRPVARKMRASVRVWSQRAKRTAFTEWGAEVGAGLGAARRVASHHARKRGEALRDAWIAWRFERLRGLRAHLDTIIDDHKTNGTRQLLRRWRAMTIAREEAYEATVLKSETFRRWVLMVQTARLSRVLLQEALTSLDADLADASASVAGVSSATTAAATTSAATSAAFTAATVTGGRNYHPAASLYSITESERAGATPGSFGSTWARRRAHFAMTPTHGNSASHSQHAAMLSGGATFATANAKPRSNRLAL